MIPTFVTSQNGDVYLNDLMKYVKGTILVPPANVNPLTTAVAPAATIPTSSTPVLFEGSEDAVTEIFSTMGAHDPTVAADIQDRLTVEITDMSYRRRLMNRPVLANHVFGSNLQPFRLNESIMLESQQLLQFQFQNNSTVGASIFRMGLEARKFQASSLANNQVTKQIAEMRQRKTFLNPFWLTSPTLPINLPASATRTIFFPNSRDYFLILFYAMAQARTTGVAGNLQSLVRLKLFDSRTDRPLMNQPILIDNLAGTSQFPFVFDAGLIMEPDMSIRAEFTNLITDAATEVWFTFHGVGSYVAEQNPYAKAMVDQPVAAPLAWGG